ncbi:13770_t:CDS:2, partial [Gigaspora rosea]
EKFNKETVVNFNKEEKAVDKVEEISFDISKKIIDEISKKINLEISNEKIKEIFYKPNEDDKTNEPGQEPSNKGQTISENTPNNQSFDKIEPVTEQVSSKKMQDDDKTDIIIYIDEIRNLFSKTLFPKTKEEK